MKIKLGIFSIILIALFVVYGHYSGLFEARLKSPPPPAYVKPVPENWPLAQQQRRQEIADHLEKHQIAFDYFGNQAVSKTDGIPLIILKLLPIVAPEYWGDEENFLSVMGLFKDPRIEGYPFPRGIGFTGLARKDEFGAIDYASFTCGGCHIGRVRLQDGSFEYLNGGVNSGFNVLGYRQRIVQSLEKIYAGETDPKKKKERVIKTLMDALETTHRDNPTYFYNNYTHNNGRVFDAEYEAKQIALFKQTASTTIPEFVNHQETVYAGWKVIAEKFYPNIKERIAAGFGGMEDAIAFNAANTYMSLQGSTLGKLFSPLALPQSHGITDIMVVWNQDSRNPRWNEDKTNLVNGGGQWNGHIPLPIYKNIAAQITLGFNNVDVTVSAYAEKLLDKLPPAIYPFDVDVELAKEGQKLFARNCANCHQPNNGKVYLQMGTDLGRALITGTFITVGAQQGFTSEQRCGPTTTVIMYGEERQPCAEYRGVSMKGNSKFAMTAPKVHNGYNALPLTGLWAQAPYLHNGSVPTLYHLLVPQERPDIFKKSRLDYDTEKVGFSWDPNTPPPSGIDEGYLFDTSSSPAISHAGHDKDVTDEGVTYKLDWSDDREGLKALLEYLKTL